MSGTTHDEYIYIDLDDPTPWWWLIATVIAAVLIVAVLIAPWVIELDNTSPEPASATAPLQNATSICRPDSSGVPDVFDSSLASWNRFCEWFIAPELEDGQ